MANLRSARRTCFVATLVSTFALAAGVACSSNDESTFQVIPDTPDTSQPDAEFRGGESEDADADAGPSSCPPAEAGPFAPTWSPPAKASPPACSTEDLEGYWAACAEDPSSKECEPWRTGHDGCAKCIEPADGSGPVQWHLDRYYYTLNLGGCIALQQGTSSDAGDAADAGASGCGEAYNAAAQCTRAPCEGCFKIGGSFEQFSACQKQVQADKTCASYQGAMSAACAGYKDAGSPARECFKKDGETSEALFTRLAGFFCGPP